MLLTIDLDLRTNVQSNPQVFTEEEGYHANDCPCGTCLAMRRQCEKPLPTPCPIADPLPHCRPLPRLRYRKRRSQRRTSVQLSAQRRTSLHPFFVVSPEISST